MCGQSVVSLAVLIWFVSVLIKDHARTPLMEQIPSAVTREKQIDVIGTTLRRGATVSSRLSAGCESAAVTFA